MQWLEIHVRSFFILNLSGKVYIHSKEEQKNVINWTHKQIFSLNCFSAIHCPPLPVWRNILFHTTDRVYNTKGLYRCQQGFNFSDNEVIRSSTCYSSGQWELALYECIGKIMMNTGVSIVSGEKNEIIAQKELYVRL